MPEKKRGVADKGVEWPLEIPNPTLIPGSTRGSNLDALPLQPIDNALENIFMG